MFSEGKSFLLRSAVLVGLISVVTTIIYLTPVPDVDFVSCERSCYELDWPMICRIKLTLEVYQTLSRSCGDCPKNSTDCFNKYCITADGFPRGVLTANRQLPGPLMQVCENDIMLVDVVNRIPGQEFSIHWRGQPQQETPVMDGVPMVTQCPATSHTTYQYKFRASKAGTHLWHAHTDSQMTDGIFGALIVRKSDLHEPLRHLYDLDDPSHVVIINEWSHGFAIQKFLDASIDTGSQVLLINGRAQVEGGAPTPRTVLRVRHGSRYRLRLAYTGGGRACPITLTVARHVLTVIAMDGQPVAPRGVAALNLSPGERVDVVLMANQANASYWLRVQTVKACEGPPVRGDAVVRYEAADPDLPPGEEENSVELPKETSVALLNTYDKDCYDSDRKTHCLTDMRAINKMPEPLSKSRVDSTIFLAYGFKVVEGDNFPGLSTTGGRAKVPHFNNLTFSYPSSPLLSQPEDVGPDAVCNKDSVPERCHGEEICECTHVIDIALGATVELVLVDQGGSEFGHVFHLHGYSFHVVGLTQLSRRMSLEQIQDLDNRSALLHRNLANPVVKDTVTVPRNGVAVLRFLADNAGYWLLHDEHSSYWRNGLNVVLHVGTARDVPALPNAFPRCGSFIGPEYFLI